MTWDPQRQAYTPGVNRPMPGPGDLWGSPEDECVTCDDCPFDGRCSTAPSFSVLDYRGCTLYQMRRRAEEEDLDELINFAAPYADAPSNNSLPFHDDCLHHRHCSTRPWWWHTVRVTEGRRGNEMDSEPSWVPCGPDDYEELPSKVARYGWLIAKRAELGSTRFAHMDRVNYGRTKPTRGVWSRP